MGIGQNWVRQQLEWLIGKHALKFVAPEGSNFDPSPNQNRDILVSFDSNIFGCLRLSLRC